MKDTIEPINKLPEKEILEKVKKYGFVIQFIRNPTEEMIYEAIKRECDCIQFIDNPSEDIQLLAVRSDGLSIQGIHNPSEYVQLEAAKQSGMSIRFINHPTERVLLESLKTLWDISQLNYIEKHFGEILSPWFYKELNREKLTRGPLDGPTGNYRRSAQVYL